MPAVLSVTLPGQSGTGQPVSLVKRPWLVVRCEQNVPTHVRSALTGLPMPVSVQLARDVPPGREPLIWRLV